MGETRAMLGPPHQEVVVHPVICSMGTSLDGFVSGPDGSFDWGAPDPELFAAIVEDFRRVGSHLMGRRLYETMLFWETDHPGLSEDEQEWSRLWRPLPKVVFSRTLTEVQGNARLATGTVAEEIACLKAEPGDSEIAIGGPELIAQAAAADLVDEYRVRVSPVLLGGGAPYYPQVGRQVDLALVESSVFPSAVVLRYRVVR